jgi:PIN domain nuclease of toxin-antitoxin system
MARTVLDASALLAFINREPGAERVTAVLGEAAISTVNFSEVVAKLALRNRSPQRIFDELTEFELEVVDFNRALAEDAGLLATATRGQGLSLGDRACLALARRENAVALTADNAWRQVQVGIEIQFIR